MAEKITRGHSCGMLALVYALCECSTSCGTFKQFLHYVSPITAACSLPEKLALTSTLLVLCQQRKVKCDKQKPKCGNCMKARAECIPSAPTLPRRRKRRLAETDLAGRLRKYEHLLKTHGIKIDDEELEKPEPDDNQVEDDFSSNKVVSMTVPRHRNAARGALFADKDKSHYVEKYFPLSYSE